MLLNALLWPKEKKFKKNIFFILFSYTIKRVEKHSSETLRYNSFMFEHFWADGYMENCVVSLSECFTNTHVWSRACSLQHWTMQDTLYTVKTQLGATKNVSFRWLLGIFFNWVEREGTFKIKSWSVKIGSKI